jgi:hypothetical protein
MQCFRLQDKTNYSASNKYHVFIYCANRVKTTVKLSERVEAIVIIIVVKVAVNIVTWWSFLYSTNMLIKQTFTGSICNQCAYLLQGNNILHYRKREPYVADSEIDLQYIPGQTPPPWHILKHNPYIRCIKTTGDEPRCSRKVCTCTY